MLAALLFGAATVCQAADLPKTTPVPTPLTVSNLPLLSLTGEKTDIAQQKGWRVLYFWSQECPCVRDCERLSLVPLSKKYLGKVAFYAIESNTPDITGNRQVLTANIAIHHLPYAVLLDPGHVVADLLKAASTPQTFLINPDNQVVFQGAPDDAPEFKALTGRPGISHAYLADALEQSLSGKPVLRPVVKTLGCGIVRE